MEEPGAGSVGARSGPLMFHMKIKNMLIKSVYKQIVNTLDKRTSVLGNLRHLKGWTEKP